MINRAKNSLNSNSEWQNTVYSHWKKITKLKGKIIIDIACGDFHSVALDNEGRVYSWGGGGSSKNKGQLGHGNMKDISQP